MSGNTAGSTGCLYYLITIRTQEPIEYIYLKAQFPDKINNYKVGLPPEYQMPDGRRVAAQIGELGKDPNGNCAVVPASNDTGDVQASAAANMLSLHASKLPPKTTIMGMVATTEGKSTISPRLGGVYPEGQYEYLKLGYTVPRQLRVSISGVIPAAAANH
jgi:hypothetical protein